MSLHQRIERRTGWLFGTYANCRQEITDPLFAIGRTIAATGFEEYPSGVYVVYVIVGNRGLYLCRADGLERGRERAMNCVEDFANGADR